MHVNHTNKSSESFQFCLDYEIKLNELNMPYLKGTGRGVMSIHQTYTAHECSEKKLDLV